MGEWRRLAILLVSAAALYLVLRYVVPLMLPLLLAAGLALAVEPAVQRLEDRGLGRGVAAFAAVGAALLLVGGAILGASVRLAGEVGSLLRVMGQLPSLWQQLGAARSVLPGPLADLLRGALRSAVDVGQSALRGLLGLLAGVPDALLFAVVVVVAAFFLARDRHLVESALRALLPEGARPGARAVHRDVVRSAAGLLRAQLVLMTTTALGTALGLTLLGQRYALLLGLLSGLLDIVPGVGPAGVLLPWSLWSALTGHLGLALQLGALLGALAALREVMEIRAVGTGLGLHPLATITALYLGVRLFGAGGVVLGPLGAVILRAVWRLLQPPGPPTAWWKEASPSAGEKPCER